MKLKTMLSVRLAVLLSCAVSPSLFAWDYEGHRAVNQIALASLPTNFPAFVFTPEARERVAFLAGEADRWRNTQDYTFQHLNEPDHFLDLDFLADYGFNATNTPAFRYDFVGAIVLARAKNPGLEPQVDTEKDTKHTQQFFGFLPWAINENYSKLKSEFSYLKTFQQNGGTPDEIKNAQENILYIMGQMGHYAGDASQPLHATKHHHGWVGANPKGYTTKRNFHSQIDGGYFAKTKLDVKVDLLPLVKPAHAIADANAGNLGVFQPVMDFIAGTGQLVEPLYEMEKAGKLSGEGTVGLEGKPFLHEQLLRGGQFLGALWLTAYETAPEDSFLKTQLTKRAKAAAEKTAPEKTAEPKATEAK
ncbi:MAG: hypothetical protein RL380_823 [Verrucomicrobiota bacterium]